MILIKLALTLNLLFIVLSLGVAKAQHSVFTITSKLENKSLGKYIEIFEDKNGGLGIEEVIQAKIMGQFKISEEEEPGFGFTSSVFWVSLTVKNPERQKIEWFLEISYPLLDHIDLYVPVGHEKFVTKKTGDRFPFNTREMNFRNFIFKLNENPLSQKTYYLRFQSESSLNMPLNAWSQKALMNKITGEQILLGIFYGAVLIMIIYNIFLFLGFGEVSYVYYVLFLSAWGFGQLTINGLAFQYIWPDSIWWANVNLPVLIFTTIFASNQFSRSLLLPYNANPAWDKFLKYANIFFLAGIGFSFFADYALSIRLATASSIIIVAILAFTGYTSVRQGSRPAKFFLTAWGFFLIGVILFALKSFGLLSGNVITNWSIQIGFFVLMLLFSIAVQDRVKLDKREKYLAQKAALENEQTLVKKLKESECMLEKKVKERTKELDIKNKSLIKTSEELKESANELDTLNNIVKIINREVEFGNVMNALLEQGLKLFPQAQQGAALIYNFETERYHFVASVGYNLDVFKNISMTVDEIESSFSDLSDEVIKGIYIIHRNENSEKDIVFNPTKSKSILAMSISLEGQLAGFLIFDNNSSSDAFSRSDAQKLSRFRSHAISAFAKAKLLLEIMRINEEIFKTQDQLIVQEKMASLGQLTAGIAHEIKNPLNFVNNFAEGSVELVDELADELNKLKNRLQKDEIDELDDIVHELKQNAIDILTNGKRADSIVRSMMDHARDSKGERQSTDINKLVDENVNLAYHGYRAINSSFNVSIKKNYSDSIAPINIIQPDIGRVLLNILSNACYAIVEKQKEKDETYSPELTISTKSENGNVEIKIHDNGPGVPLKIRDKIFTPFFTTKPTCEGNTGLGLSISYDIVVQKHHGKIEVNSEPGQFTEFVISLPISAEMKF